VSRVELVSRLRMMIAEESTRRPAIVHTHLFGGDFYGALSRGLSQGMRLPRLVSTLHGIDRDDSSLRRLARRWAVRRMDRVVAVSGAVARYAKQNLGVREDRIEVIPNGVDISRIVARGNRPFHEVPRLLIVGRLGPEKGHGVLFDALASVSPPWRLDVVGSGILERELRERAERLGIASRVVFLGERDDVGSLLSDADLFCFPSKWEGMGLALVEAMAAGVPILASDLLAVREFAPKSRLVDAASACAWTDAIRATLASPLGAIAQAQKLEPTIRKRYGIDGMIAGYAEMYGRLLG
jgi:glycosyltransferase involved in cell wall biosynthesis